jgi:DNA (cytosine-5)-methyltransferase 1
LWWVADAIQPGLQGHTGYVDDRDESGRLDPQPMRSVTTTSGSGWGNNWIPCGDGKARRIEPGLAPLAHAVSVRVAAMRPNGQLHWYNRTGAIKGFGNAIVPGVAAEFIKAYMECRP